MIFMAAGNTEPVEFVKLHESLLLFYSCTKILLVYPVNLFRHRILNNRLKKIDVQAQN